MQNKSNKRSNKLNNKRKQTRRKKQKHFMMIGCSNKNKSSYKNNKVFLSLGNKHCSKCDEKCHRGSNCNCPGNFYLNRRIKKQKGGSGCGSGSCPIGGLSYKQMKQFGGDYNSYPKILKNPIIIQPPSKDEYSSILGIGQNGGNCGVCGQTQVNPQYGGNFFKEIGPMPGPFTGSDWEPNKLPGENGISGDRNYLKSYTGSITNDPQLKMTMDGTGYKTTNSMVGGYTYNKKRSSSSKKGGGIIPQDLVNLGRDFTFNFKNAYNTLNGYKPPVDHTPYKDQLTGALNNNRFML